PAFPPIDEHLICRLMVACVDRSTPCGAWSSVLPYRPALRRKGRPAGDQTLVTVQAENDRNHRGRNRRRSPLRRGATAMWDRRSVSVIPMTYAEEDSIRGVIEDFYDTGIGDEVLVVNNNAEPGAADEVAATLARRVFASCQGYGYASRRLRFRLSRYGRV